MEERIKKIVENTFNNFEGEELKQVIVDRMLQYEKKINELKGKQEKVTETTRLYAGREVIAEVTEELTEEEKETINKLIEKRYREALRERRRRQRERRKKE